jgi:ribonucleoside-triphosphate reductase
MIKYVIKRDGKKVKFDSSKIYNAISAASNHHQINLSDKIINGFVRIVIERLKKINSEYTEIEKIQDCVVEVLSENNRNLANVYEQYRIERNRQRDLKSNLMKTINRIGVETDRDNANVGNNFSAKLLRIASESNK